MLHEDTAFDEIVESVGPRSRDEELVLYLTDMPRRRRDRPVVAELHQDHQFAMNLIRSWVSEVWPWGRRVDSIVGLTVAHLLDEPHLATPVARRRFPVRACRVHGAAIFSPPGLACARLLAGMVRANRPWRLVTGLSKAMAGAFATGAIALATSTIWLFADLMGPWRMSAATDLSIAAMVVWLIVDHELWERPASRQERARSTLYNVATVMTLLIGVLAFHVALFGLLLFTAGVALPPSLFAQTLETPCGRVRSPAAGVAPRLHRDDRRCHGIGTRGRRCGPVRRVRHPAAGAHGADRGPGAGGRAGRSGDAR